MSSAGSSSADQPGRARLDAWPADLGRLFEALGDGLLLVDDRGRIVHVNDRLAAMSGYRAQELEGKEIEELVPERLRGAHELNRRRYSAAPGVRAMGVASGLFLSRKDGTELAVDIALSPLRVKNDALTMGVVRDVSEPRRAEEAVGRRDAILEAVAFAAERFLGARSWEESIHAVLARLGSAADVSRAYVFANRRGEDGVILASRTCEWNAPGVAPQIDKPTMRDFPWIASGFRRWAEVLGSGQILVGNVREMSDAERLVLASEGVSSVLRAPLFVGGEWWGGLGVELCDEEREFLPAEVDALKAAAGALAAAIAREEVDERLREAELRFRTLVEQIPAVTYIDVNEPGAETWPTVYISPQLETILGYEPAEWIEDARLWLKMLHPDDRDEALAAYERHYDTGMPIDHVYRLIAKDGRVVWVRDEAVIVAVEGTTRRYARGVLYDITEQKQAEEELASLAREQTALAELGRRALVGTDLSSLMDHAVEVVAEVLEVEYAKILELLPEGRELLLLAGVGWREQLVRQATVPAGKGSQAGYTLHMGEPVVVEDLRSESRFSGPELLTSHGVVSGLSVPIPGRERPFGVLGAHTAERRVFPDHSVRFLQTVANVLAEAIGRLESEEELRESLELLRKTDAERRRLVARLVRVQEEERARIASDIHDDPLQKIAAVGMRLGTLKRDIGDAAQLARFEDIERTVSLTAASLRHLLFEVRPLALDREGLAAAIREYLEQTSEEAGFTFALDGGLADEPPREIRALCYRIAQEAIANVRSHAGAERVEVNLDSEEAGIRVTIHDDGRGFRADDLHHVPGHLGLADMRERAELAGGWLRIESEPGVGTTVDFWIPAVEPRS